MANIENFKASAAVISWERAGEDAGAPGVAIVGQLLKHAHRIQPLDACYG